MNTKVSLSERLRVKDWCFNSQFAAAPSLIFALTALFSSVCFMLNIQHIEISLILAIIIVFVWGLKGGKSMLISLGATLALTLISIIIAGHVYDMSYDGMYFHKEAVYALANGWNPWRLSFWYYSFFGKLQDLALWLDNYPKGVWSFYACIYSIFGEIEYAKGANMIFVLMLFFTASNTISSVFNKKGIMGLVLALVFTANPVIASQFFTYMNDLPVAAFTMICAFLGMKIYADKADKWDYICLAAVFASSFAVKFTAPVFCGVTLAGFGVAKAIKNRGKDLLKPCLTVILAAAIGVCVLGADPYIKHIAEGKNPVYPVMGEGKYDIMNTNAPEGIDEMSNPAALITSIFARTSPNPEDRPVLKIPFTIDTEYEIWGASAPDARMGGFGLWFSGILLLSLILGIFALRKTKGAMALVPALIVFTIMALFFPETWWARYNPYIYYIPCLILLAFSMADKKRLISAAMSVIILINSGFCGVLVFQSFYRQTKTVKWRINELKETGRHIMFCINDFPCHEIWFNEHGLDFELVPNFKDEAGEEFFKTTRYQLK